MTDVLVVDDEPIILSGIKFLIDWEACGCRIVGTARNGKQALEQIRTLRPGVVICDISMPVLSGTQLLEQCAEEFPEIVFIMLTNHEDFDLARHSLRWRAADYLLKSQLEPDALRTSLLHACEEHETRVRLTHARLSDESLRREEERTLRNAMTRLILAPQGSPMRETAAVLAKAGVLDGFGALYLPIMSRPSVRGDELRRVFECVSEIAQSLAETMFSHSLPIADDTQRSLYVLCWGVEAGSWEQAAETFAAKCAASCETVAKACVQPISTDMFHGEEGVQACRGQLACLCRHYYLTGKGGGTYRSLTFEQPRPLGLSGLGGCLATELRAKNPVGVQALLERASARIRETPHEKSHALWLCSEIFDAAQGELDEEREAPLTLKRQEIRTLATRAEVLRWLTALSNELAGRLEKYSSTKLALIEKARQYVRDNADKRIMLSDAADYVCISPGYLSSLFKKLYNQNFVDYINEVKVERACEMIREGSYRVSEIADRLSFGNAYYFSRVFKRHTGMTPTEYQKKHGGAHEE